MRPENRECICKGFSTNAEKIKAIYEVMFSDLDELDEDGDPVCPSCQATQPSGPSSPCHEAAPPAPVQPPRGESS